MIQGSGKIGRRGRGRGCGPGNFQGRGNSETMLTHKSRLPVAPAIEQAFQPQLQISNSAATPVLNPCQGTSIEIGQSSGSLGPFIEIGQSSCSHQAPNESLPSRNLEGNVGPTQQADNDGAVSCRNKKRGRGKYKSKSMDAKTKGGAKITVKIPDDIVRAVGPGARDIVNYSGLALRTTISCRDGAWKNTGSKHVKAMWLKVKDKFQISGSEKEDLLQEFVTSTMRRLFRAWKARLSAHYSLYDNDKDRLADRPEDVEIEDWKYLVYYFGTPEFKAVSERNKKNRGKQITKHTCGTKSFAEIEESTRDPETGEKKSPDIVWEIQHTHKNDRGEVVWLDPKSQQIHDQLVELVAEQQPAIEQPMSGDEILLSTLGARTGYVRGKGYGKKAAKKSRIEQADIEASVSSAVNIVRAEMQTELQKERDKMAIELQRKEEEWKKQLEEEREHMRLELDKRMKEQMATIMMSMLQQGQGC